MSPLSIITCLPLAVLFFSSGCSEKAALADFKSDGCSLFPDRSLIDEKDWCRCCVEHDVAYWQGGTKAQRLAADVRLRECVLEQTGDPVLAEAMFQGVRFGGSPDFYNWYRWGYGWTDNRGYRELTLEEQRLVTEKLVEYYANAETTPCGGIPE